MKKKTKKRTTAHECERVTTVSYKITRILFVCVVSIILFLLLFFGWRQYCLKNNLIIPNLVLLLIVFAISFLVLKLFRHKQISQKQFTIIIVSSFAILFLFQIFIILFSYFFTGWDAGFVNSLADQSAKGTGWIGDEYLTMYPNNIVLTAMLKMIKMIPVFGNHYVFLLAISALFVNLAGLFACLTIKEMISRKSAVMAVAIVALLIVLNPWFMIPYSDAFAILIPILMFYIYIKNKQWWRFVIIGALGVFGYLIKPTAAIMLIAIFAIEIITKKPKITKTLIKRALFIIGAITYVLLLKPAAAQYIGFRQYPELESASFVHYLAMGQNDQTCGGYFHPDVEEYREGKNEFKKFCDRILGRSFGENIDFFAKKTLANFNDGTFAWGVEGTFYARVPERNNAISDILANYYYSNGKNYKVFGYIRQAIWIFVLFCCVFLFLKRKNDKDEKKHVLALAILGISAFVTLFESRARYLYCYAPIFVVCAAVGYYNLRQFIVDYRKKKTKLH